MIQCHECLSAPQKQICERHAADAGREVRQTRLHQVPRQRSSQLTNSVRQRGDVIPTEPQVVDRQLRDAVRQVSQLVVCDVQPLQ